MYDFTSALYLGMYHKMTDLRSWKSFTTGIPAALAEPEANLKMMKLIAELQGTESCALSASTLHLFQDLLDIFGDEEMVIYFDKGAYPIVRWGLVSLLGGKNKLVTFPHYDPFALDYAIRHNPPGRKRVIIIADSVNPSTGKPVPLSDYLSVVKDLNCYVILDDTQSFGILGHSPTGKNVYGYDGGGILQWTNNTMHKNVILVSSMAKAFGVPIAVLSSSRDVIQKYKEVSRTRVYCSPPSNADAAAAEHALKLNKEMGNKLRRYLLSLICYFRELMTAAGFTVNGNFFPVQTLSSDYYINPISLHQGLSKVQIKTVLHRDRISRGILLSILLNTTHKRKDIDYLVSAIINQIKRRNREVKNVI